MAKDSLTQKQTAQKLKQQKILKPIVNENQEPLDKPSKIHHKTKRPDDISQSEGPVQNVREDALETEQSTLLDGQSVLSNKRPSPDILVQVQTPTSSLPLDESSQAVLFQSPLVKQEPIQETNEECSKLTVPIIELNQAASLSVEWKQEVLIENAARILHNMVDLTHLVDQCHTEEVPLQKDSLRIRRLNFIKNIEECMKALISTETNTCDEKIMKDFFDSSETAFTNQMVDLETNDTTQKTLVVIFNLITAVGLLFKFCFLF